MGVPTSVETGRPDKRLDFYSKDMPMDYGVANDWESHRVANQVKDCRSVNPSPPSGLRKSQDDQKYTSCAHVIPEIWGGYIPRVQSMVQDGVLQPRHATGALGHQSWYVPKFTGEHDASLLHFLGLQGEQNRQKLAETFKRPTTWKEYCDLVSETGCATPDEVAKRAPSDLSEENRMFAPDLYTGHFRATDQNDCTNNPATCTGHIVDYPCGWNSNTAQLTYHLNIALESNGPDGTAGGYSYQQMTEIWAAANATKSHVMMQWWTPEALHLTYQGTDAEFQIVGLPPPTQECVEARVTSEERCAMEATSRVGEAIGACAEPSHPLYRAVTASLYEMSTNREIPEAKLSPAFDVINALEISDLEINAMLAKWLNQGADKYGYDPRNAVCEWVVDNFEALQAVLPKGYPRTIQQSKNGFNDLRFIATVVFAVMALMVVCGSIVLTYRARHSKVFLLAQIEFIWLILGGLLCLAMAGLLLTFSPSNAGCASVAWLINFGYTLELVPLIVKLTAINRIMRASSRKKRVVVKLSQLFGGVILFLVLVAGVLAVLTHVERPQPITHFELTEEETLEEETIVRTTSYCSTLDSSLWTYLSLAWHAVLLMFATAFVVLTRNIPKDVNESGVIAVMIYSQFFFLVLRAIFSFLRDTLDQTQTTYYLSVVLSCDTSATCFIYFFPKVFRSGSTTPGTKKGPPLRKSQSACRKDSRSKEDGSGADNSQHILGQSHEVVSQYSRCEALKGALSELGYDTSFSPGEGEDDADFVFGEEDE